MKIDDNFYPLTIFMKNLHHKTLVVILPLDSASSRNVKKFIHNIILVLELEDSNSFSKGERYYTFNPFMTEAVIM